MLYIICDPLDTNLHYPWWKFAIKQKWEFMKGNKKVRKKKERNALWTKYAIKKKVFRLKKNP